MVKTPYWKDHIVNGVHEVPYYVMQCWVVYTIDADGDKHFYGGYESEDMAKCIANEPNRGYYHSTHN